VKPKAKSKKSKSKKSKSKNRGLRKDRRGYRVGNQVRIVIDRKIEPDMTLHVDEIDELIARLKLT